MDEANIYGITLIDVHVYRFIGYKSVIGNTNININSIKTKEDVALTNGRPL